MSEPVPRIGVPRSSRCSAAGPLGGLPTMQWPFITPQLTSMEEPAAVHPGRRRPTGVQEAIHMSVGKRNPRQHSFILGRTRAPTEPIFLSVCRIPGRYFPSNLLRDSRQGGHLPSCVMWMEFLQATWTPVSPTPPAPFIPFDADGELFRRS